MYFEEHTGPAEAIAREKQIKGWLRAKELKLVEAMNPGFDDLAEGWYEENEAADSSVARALSD